MAHNTRSNMNNSVGYARPAAMRHGNAVGVHTLSHVICYNKKKWPGEHHPKSWADFWDVKKFPGTRGLRRSAKYTLEIALLADGVAPGERHLPEKPFRRAGAEVDIEIEQRRTQRFAVRIQRQRARHAASQRLVHHEIQRGQIGQFITNHLALNNTREMRFHPRGRYLFEQQRIVFCVIGNDGDIGDVALVAGAGMGDRAQLHPHAPTNRTCGFASSRGSSNVTNAPIRQPASTFGSSLCSCSWMRS